jgi:ribosomal protein L35
MAEAQATVKAAKPRFRITQGGLSRAGGSVTRTR